MKYQSGDTCEPCGQCPWCAQRWTWKEQATARGTSLRAALKLMRELVVAVQEEINAAMPCDDHPTYQAHERLLKRARRFLATHTEPKT